MSTFNIRLPMRLVQRHVKLGRPVVVKRPVVKRLACAALISPADINWYALSAQDVFVAYATRNFFVFHLPCVVLYRNVIGFSWGHTAGLVLMLSVFKSMVESHI